jgi:hypothetical protein
LHFTAVDEMVAHILIVKLNSEHVECGVPERESASCANVAWAGSLTARVNGRTRARPDGASGSGKRDVLTGVKAMCDAKRTCEPRRSARADIANVPKAYRDKRAWIGVASTSETEH